MVNPFEWLTAQVADTIYFLQNLDSVEFFAFFWPALLLDFPRFVLTDVYALIQALFFPDRWERTEFAQRLRGGDPPLVSVLIAGHNEAGTIENCLRSLSENTYPNKEIIIIDDGSTDGMGEVCQRLAPRYGIRYLRHRVRQGKSAAINHGIHFSRGEFVMFGDADTTYDRDAIDQAILPFADPRVGAVSANLRVRNADASITTRMQAVEYNLGIGVGRRFMAAANLLSIVSGAFGVFRRRVLEEVGGFDVGPGEDADVSIKIRKAGYRIAFAPRAICMTNAPLTPWQFLKQRLRWSRSTVRLRMRRHKDLYGTTLYNLPATVAMLDSIFYSLVLLALRLPYYSFLCVAHPHLLVKILFASWFFYAVGTVIQFWVAFVLSERKGTDLKLLPVLPFYSVFCLFHGFVRLYAYVDEFFFFSSYRDKYVPPWVQARQDPKGKAA